MLERNFASLLQSFPTLMASCACVEFLQAVHDISSAWAQHLRGSQHPSLADHRVPSLCMSATCVFEDVLPFGLPQPSIHRAQAAEPSDQPSSLHPSPAPGEELPADQAPAAKAVLAVFHASATAAVCPLSQPALHFAVRSDDSAYKAGEPLETPPIAAPGQADSVPPQPRTPWPANAGEAVDAELPVLGQACEIDFLVNATLLWDADGAEAWGGNADRCDCAGEKEAWMDGGHWSWGGDVGSERWSESGSDLEGSG